MLLICDKRKQVTHIFYILTMNIKTMCLCCFIQISRWIEILYVSYYRGWPRKAYSFYIFKMWTKYEWIYHLLPFLTGWHYTYACVLFLLYIYFKCMHQVECCMLFLMDWQCDLICRFIVKFWMKFSKPKVFISHFFSWKNYNNRHPSSFSR